MFCYTVLITQEKDDNICIEQISLHNNISELLVLALCISSTICAVVRSSCHLPAKSSTHDLLTVAVGAVVFFLSTTCHFILKANSLKKLKSELSHLIYTMCNHHIKTTATHFYKDCVER